MKLGADILNLKDTAILGEVGGFKGEQGKKYNDEVKSLDSRLTWFVLELPIDGRKNWVLLECQYEEKNKLIEDVARFRKKGGNATVNIADYGRIVEGPTTEVFNAIYQPNFGRHREVFGKTDKKGVLAK
jgi:hypothetical protein